MPDDTGEARTRSIRLALAKPPNPDAAQRHGLTPLPANPVYVRCLVFAGRTPRRPMPQLFEDPAALELLSIKMPSDDMAQ